MTDEELKALVAGLAEESEKTLQSLKETKQIVKENALQMKDTDRRLKELGIQIGGLGEKFGSFTEGMALPSMSKILRKQFKMEFIMPNIEIRKGGEEVEIDVLAYANSSINEVYVVEVKSHAKDEAITQMKALLAKFKTWFPEHKDKAVYGILTAVKMSKTVHEKAIKAGLYVANIHDDVFALDVPKHFKPVRF